MSQFAYSAYVQNTTCTYMAEPCRAKNWRIFLCMCTQGIPRLANLGITNGCSILIFEAFAVSLTFIIRRSITLFHSHSQFTSISLSVLTVCERWAFTQTRSHTRCSAAKLKISRLNFPCGTAVTACVDSSVTEIQISRSRDRWSRHTESPVIRSNMICLVLSIP